MTYTFIPLAYPLPGVGPAYYTYGHDINDSGQVSPWADGDRSDLPPPVFSGIVKAAFAPRWAP